MAGLLLRAVEKRFGKTSVLHGVDLEIGHGEFVVLVGPSGCGKSTLLRCIAGLERVSGGEIHIGDRQVNDLPPKARDIAMVFQSYALYPHMTVRDNMSFGLKIRRMEKSDITSRVDEAASLLGLESLLDRYPRQLSGGQRQRVAMGRAIVRRPEVFLFDEPLSNLDASLRVQMRVELAKLHQRLGATMIYVTHDQVEAMTLADRIVVLNGGVVQQVGAPLELYGRPANQFVAGFIGSPAMNFIPATTVDGNTVDVLGSKIGHHLSAVDAAQSQPLLFGIRPEHLLPVDAAEAELQGLVEVVEPMGAETHLHLKLMDPQGQPRDELPMVIARVQSTEAKPGSKIHLKVATENVRLFEADSGAALGESAVR
jgi:multiple sugar transport system ATP-binding protein